MSATTKAAFLSKDHLDAICSVFQDAYNQLEAVVWATEKAREETVSSLEDIGALYSFTDYMGLQLEQMGERRKALLAALSGMAGDHDEGKPGAV